MQHWFTHLWYMLRRSLQVVRHKLVLNGVHQDGVMLTARPPPAGPHPPGEGAPQQGPWGWWGVRRSGREAWGTAGGQRRGNTPRGGVHPPLRVRTQSSPRQTQPAGCVLGKFEIMLTKFLQESINMKTLRRLGRLFLRDSRGHATFRAFWTAFFASVGIV